MDANQARVHFRAAIAAARPQERLQLRRMAEASLALAERRAGDLKVATEKLGAPAPTNRQLLMLRVMGVVLPPKSAGLPRRIGGILLIFLAIAVMLTIGWGIVKLIALPFGGIGEHGLVLRLPADRGGARRDGVHRAKAPADGAREDRGAARRAVRRQAVAHTPGSSPVTPGVLPPFWTLVETHGDELLVHARKLAGDAQAEDVLQDALLRALRAYPRLRHAEHLRAWLYRVTTSAAIDHHRRRRQEVPTEEPPVVATHDHYDDGAFESLIEPLNETAQTALRLRFVDDLDYDGIAARLGCSTVAARQRVSTAVRTLRESYA